MPRLVFAPGQLQSFIKSARATIPLKREGLAKQLGVSGRTLADWQREKFYPNQDTLAKLSKLANLPLPTPTEIRKDWWSGQVNGPAGAKARFNKHGCSFTREQARKGGRVSQQRRKENPEYYRTLGCTIRRQFKYPSKKNPQFAEFIGIMLGDGHLNKTGQFTITLNSIADKKYIFYVRQLIHNLFGHTPPIFDKNGCNAVCIYQTGIELVDFLVKCGMKTGNKVKQQVGVPSWIKQSNQLATECTKGLMDTDGGIFFHRYRVNNKLYTYPKLCFANLSQPLRYFVRDTLLLQGLNPKLQGPKNVWLYSKEETKAYLRIIGSSNPRLLNKLQ